MATTEPSFQFRLERVRALRERKEDLARRDLAEAIAQLSDSRERLRAIDAHLQQARAEQRLAGTASTAVSGAELQARQAFVERVEAQRSADARELERHEHVVADRDALLGEAARDHEMLERLKERKRGEHEREAQRRESQTLDEIAIDRFRRSAA